MLHFLEDKDTHFITEHGIHIPNFVIADELRLKWSFNVISASSGLTIVPVVSWEAPPAARGPDQLPIFTTLHVFTSELWENVHKLQVSCRPIHVTFGLNDRRIPIQYHSWSATGFGEAIELIARRVKLLDTDKWLFCFDTLCPQLAYMIYITNANARINILSTTTIHRRVFQRSQDP